jgi:hypothetical protein
MSDFQKIDNEKYAHVIRWIFMISKIFISVCNSDWWIWYKLRIFFNGDFEKPLKKIPKIFIIDFYIFFLIKNDWFRHVQNFTPQNSKKKFKNSFNVHFMPPWLIRRSTIQLIQTLNSSVLTSFLLHDGIR